MGAASTILNLRASFKTVTWMSQEASAQKIHNDLRAATLSTDEAEAAPYSAIPDGSSRPTQTLSKTSASPTVIQPTRSAAATPSSSSSASGTNTSAVIGGTVAGLALVIIITYLAFLLWRRRRGRQPTPDFNILPSNKASPASSYQSSKSASPTTADIPSEDSSSFTHELDSNPPTPGPWHAGPEKAYYEMPSPVLKTEKTAAEGSKNGPQIYKPYRPSVREGQERHELGGGGKGANVCYELHG
ncbi:MAG: hypothetical protein Q9193_001359 [Seirophora villosa]